MSKKEKLFLFLGIAFLVIIFTPSFGALYELYISPVTNWFWGPSHPEYIEGFFMAYMFFTAFVLSIFGGKSKYKNLAILLGIFLALDIILGAKQAFWIDLQAGILGLILGHISYLLYSKIKGKSV